MDHFAYVMLMASLPILPPLPKLKQLPLSDLRVEARMNLLDPKDRPLFEGLMGYFDDTTNLKQRPVMPALPDEMPDLVDLVKGLTDARYVAAMLRRKHRQLPFPNYDKTPPATYLATQVRQRWNEANFGLERLMPWLIPFQQALKQGDALALQRQWLLVQWAILDRHQGLHLFDFYAVFAYALRYRLARQWLLLQSPVPAAAAKFTQLATYAPVDASFEGDAA